jgi:enoyl-CoA hydratase/carnithine racemase
MYRTPPRTQDHARGPSLDPEAAAQIGYVDEVVAPGELLDRAIARANLLGRRLKFAVAAVKRTAYIGSSRSLEKGLHVERAEFLSTLANSGAQKAMIACVEQTTANGDLPLYDRQTYERFRDTGHFG